MNTSRRSMSLQRWALRTRYDWDQSPLPLVTNFRTLMQTRFRPFAGTDSTGGALGPSIGYAGVPGGIVKVLQTLERQREILGTATTARRQYSVRRTELIRGRSLPDTDLVAVVCAPSQAGQLPPHRSIVAPYRLHAVVDVTDGDWRGRVSKSERKWFRARRKSRDFTLEPASDEESFHFFYDRMHLPTMRLRHGGRARTESKESAYECLFRRGLLAFVNVEGVRVAGLLGRRSGDGKKITSRLVGVLDGDEKLHGESWLKAGNHLLLEWAESNGVERVDFSGLEAWISKGVFQRKRQLGPRMEFAPNHQGNLRVWWHVRRDTPTVRDFLAANPIAEINGEAGLRAVYFYDDRRPVRHDLPYRCANITESRNVHLDDFLREPSN